jgi:hypothetical protein
VLDRLEAILAEHPLLHRPRPQPLPTRKDRPHAPAEDADGAEEIADNE